MTANEKFAALELLATRLLQECKVDKSPIFSPYNDGNYHTEIHLGRDRNKSLFDMGWRFEWSRSKKRIGCCQYSTKTIQLSRLYVENTKDPNLFVNTILHEIAHALTPGHNHDNIWKKACVIVGANPERLCNDEQIVGANQHLARWIAKCPHCTFTHSRHRKPKYINNMGCAATNHCRLTNQRLIWKENKHVEA